MTNDVASIILHPNGLMRCKAFHTFTLCTQMTSFLQKECFQASSDQVLVNDFVCDIRIGGGGVLIVTYLLQALHLLSIVLYDQLLKVAVKSSSLLLFCHLYQLCLSYYYFFFQNEPR